MTGKTVNKRYREPLAKEGELLVQYGKDDAGDLDIQYCWPENDSNMSRDSLAVMHALEKADIYGGGSLVSQLKDRGYDITTLKFTIRKMAGEEK